MHTMTGYDLCKPCKEKFDEGYLALVVIDAEKSKPSIPGHLKIGEAYRTGEVIHLRRSIARKMFKGLSDERAFVYTDEEMSSKLKELAKRIGGKKDGGKIK